LGFNKLTQVIGIGLVFSSELHSQTGRCHSIFIEGVALPLNNLRINAKLLTTDEGKFFVVALTDISQQNHQRSMEQIFFHDLLNTAGGMQGMSEVLLDADPEDVSDIQDSVHHLAAQLVDEITAHRDYISAENGNLQVNPSRLQSRRLLHSLAKTYDNHPSSGHRKISVLENNGPWHFITNPAILFY